MSRVRIYELAKEAGMSSKALAEKLIASGYDIKGHSSTVDEETADKIRETVLQDSNTELVEKRIDASEGSTTVIRRRSTIIRRRPKVEEPSEPEKEVEPDPAISAEHGEEQPEDVQTEVELEPAPVAETEEDQAEIREEEGAVEEKDQVEDEVSADSAAEQDPVVEAAIDEEPEGQNLEDAVEPEEAVSAKTKKKPKKQPKVERKKIARVVGTIELPVDEKPEKETRQRAKKGGKSTAARSARPNLSVVMPGEAVGETPERGRKKGRRGTGEEDELDRRAKGGRKGKKSVKFTHFDSDYQRGGKRGKRNKGRVEKKVSPSTIEMKASKKKITVYDTITVGDIASKMKVKASEVIAKLMGLGVMATMNQAVDVDTATLIAGDFGYEIEQGMTEEIGVQLLDAQEEGGGHQASSAGRHGYGACRSWQNLNS